LGGLIFVWNKPISKQKLAHKITKSLNLLHKFVEMFPIAEPRYYMYQGLADHLLSGSKSAKEKDKIMVSFWKGQKAAEKLSMLYEVGMAYVHLGSSKNYGPECTEEPQASHTLLVKGCEIFTKIGVHYTEFLWFSEPNPL